MYKSAKSGEKWIQKAEQEMERKGTKGKFTRWCQQRGYTEATYECIRKAIKEAKKTGNTKLLREALFALRMHEIARKRKKASSFLDIIESYARADAIVTMWGV